MYHLYQVQKQTAETKKGDKKLENGTQNEIQNVDSILVYIPTEELDKLSAEEEKKQFLGNYLYPYVLRKIQQDEQAKDSKVTTDKIQNMTSKVTGMIISG